MGYSGASDLVLTAGKHAQHLLDSGVDKITVEKMLYDILQDVADMDFDDFDSCVGHWEVLDRVMDENEFVILAPSGDFEIKHHVSAYEWSVHEKLVDYGKIANNSDKDYYWLKHAGTEIDVTMVVDFDEEEVYLTHVGGVKLPNRVKV